MPNVASILKEEITRLARKEVKTKTDAMAERLVELRRAVGALRKQLASLDKAVSNIKGKVSSDEIISADEVADKDVAKSRITGGRIAALRAKLGLSRNEMALLLDVNANSIYLWERGKTRPRAAAKAKLIQLRGLGKRAVVKLVNAAKGGEKSAAAAGQPKKRRRRRARKVNQAAVAATPAAESSAT